MTWITPGSWVIGTCEECGKKTGPPPEKLGKWFCECGHLLGIVKPSPDPDVTADPAP